TGVQTCALPIFIAEKGKRVLLIDGDLRIPSIAKKMGISSTPGLTDLLMGKGAQVRDFRSNVLENLFIIPSGEIPPNPSELLGSQRMKSILLDLKGNFDYIIIDLPPANVVSDALSVAEFISGMVLVVRENYTEKKELERCFRQMDISNIKVLGCVMNESREKSGSYGKYKKYKTYQSSTATKTV
ncbi:MAG: CpsD/CapB family tyrosine-protein kinase, partial [Clostridia bacterium]|nr:CpsD/CapB family tyrosine-protein kinase [Clostridia bacterium]